MGASSEIAVSRTRPASSASLAPTLPIMPRYAAQIGSTLTGLRRTHGADLGNVGCIHAWRSPRMYTLPRPREIQPASFSRIAITRAARPPPPTKVGAPFISMSRRPFPFGLDLAARTWRPGLGTGAPSIRRSPAGCPDPSPRKNGGRGGRSWPQPPGWHLPADDASASFVFPTRP